MERTSHQSHTLGMDLTTDRDILADRLTSVERRLQAIENRYSFDNGAIYTVREFIEQWLQEHEYVAVAQIRWELSHLYAESAIRQCISIMWKQHKLVKISVGVYRRCQ